MSKPLSSFRKAWLNWKTLRLPWRKRFLVGLDLEGNTYWEFKDLRGDASPDSAITRWRRIVEYPSGTHPGAVKVSPQWHQWLRYVRQHPPSLAEQQQDVVRQQQMRVLAAKADARWAGAKRVDGPIDAAEAAAAGLPEFGVGSSRAVPLPGTGPATAATTTTTQSAQPAQATPQPKQTQTPPQTPPRPPPPQQTIYPSDPWKKEELARGAPGQSWQPQAWTPPASKR